ncbi:phage tail protein [Lichenibacterium dinghuense]|uniref:phage tail protein n=1 Tax=Lichenibacterium dinghuense TaxID=2895977 RepID=UPI001F2E64D5|nr:tail fiber protein [Lichenibacterium sp. 6Y81]
MVIDMEVFIGTIQPFAFGFAPSGWAQCQGQILNVSQNQALFALLNFAYGGNGSSTFGLPDLRGRTMMGQGQQPGGSSYVMGQTGGAETATLQTTNLPPHTHALNGSSAQASQAAPGGSVLATANGADGQGQPVSVQVYGPAGSTTPLDPSSIGQTGSGTKFGILPPFQVINTCIALQGLFPTRS